MRGWGIVRVWLALLAGCSDARDSERTQEVEREPALASEWTIAPLFDRVGRGDKSEFVGCPFASPRWYEGEGGPSVIVAESAGTVSALEPETGTVRWQTTLPAPEGQDPLVLATPVIVGARLVVAYHTTPTPPRTRSGANVHTVIDLRLSQRVAVLRLSDGALDPAFPVVTLRAEHRTADGGRLRFDPAQALARGALAHVTTDPGTLGLVYVTFGNARDIQPWHGWAFELDLDTWQRAGSEAAISAVLVTTPERDEACGTRGASGSRERRCGGGLWSPAGPLVLNDEAGVSIVLAAGNGQLDLARKDYANTLLRVRPGLAFDPECNPAACTPFDRDAPSLDCVDSCRNLFVPRALPGQSVPHASGLCAGLSMFACWERLDYVGGSSPSLVNLEGWRLLAHPTKDGYLQLIDADHLGTMHDRVQLVEACGTARDPCLADWAGMIVTQPAIAAHEGVPIVIVPTFMPDRTHPAGVVAHDVVLNQGRPSLRRRWEFPDFTSSDAVARFRWHPSRAALTTLSGHGQVAFVVETGDDEPAVLHGLRVRDGRQVLSAKLRARGIRFAEPLVHQQTIYVPSCADSQTGPGTIEAFRIVEHVVSP